MRVRICEKLKDNEKEYKKYLNRFVIQFYILLFINIKCY